MLWDPSSLNGDSFLGTDYKWPNTTSFSIIDTMRSMGSYGLSHGGWGQEFFLAVSTVKADNMLCLLVYCHVQNMQPLEPEKAIKHCLSVFVVGGVLWKNLFLTTKRMSKHAQATDSLKASRIRQAPDSLKDLCPTSGKHVPPKGSQCTPYFSFLWLNQHHILDLLLGMSRQFFSLQTIIWQRVGEFK